MNELVGALWFFLPAGIANAVPVLASKTPLRRKFDTPMDFGKSFKDVRLFGDNKTWRGLFAGVIGATIVIALQIYLYATTTWAEDISWVNYNQPDVWLLGPLMGAGTLLADAMESHFKRRRNIPPGEKWFPFDQLDYIVGGCLFSLPVVILSLPRYLLIFVMWFGVHLLVVYVGFKLGIRDKPI